VLEIGKSLANTIQFCLANSEFLSMIEKVRYIMTLKNVDQNNQDSVFSFLDDVLAYYKTAEDASLGEWPTLQIGREDFQKTQKFYCYVNSWFANRNITVIKHNKTKRYLSTFILAAEFPPTLGYGKLIEELVRQFGWLSLYHSPEDNLIEYINSIEINSYTVAQQQSLRSNSEGFYALLNLIEILASIRYSLDSLESLDSICVTVSEKKGWDLDLVLRVSHAYKDIIIPPQKTAEQRPTPSFSYQLIEEGNTCNLVIKHNLRNKISIPLPSSISLPRFTSGTISLLSESKNAIIDEVSQLVKLEVQEGFLEINTSFQNDFIPVAIRNRGLKRIQFIISVRDTDAQPQQLLVGQINRSDNFLIFGESGTEIISNTHLFKQGQTLRIVPLVDNVGSALQKSIDFIQEEQTGNLPVFQTVNTQGSSIKVGKTELQFRSIPFTIKLREQTAWEATFNRSRRIISFFFSPMMEMCLEGDFPENMVPTLKLEKRINNTDGEESRILIITSYTQGRIRPIQPLPSPGQYTLSVAFGDDKPSSITFNLLPIRAIRLIEDRHIQLKMYAPVKDFQLLDSDTCNCSFTEKFVDIYFNEYGMQDIEAKYFYQYSDRYKVKSTLRFKFEAIEEVTGHFEKEIRPNNAESLSLERDLIANSYLEFHRTSLRNSAHPYKISAYMEYSQKGLRIIPQSITMYTEGVKPYSLASLVAHVRTHQYARLLIIVEYEETELYRAEFLSNRRPILDLEREWNQGAYASLTALPLDSLQSEKYQSIEALPENCLVYGMDETALGEQKISTFPVYIHTSTLSYNSLATTFLARCNEFLYPDETNTNLLQQILKSPDQSYELMKWFSLANAWDYPYDIKLFAKFLDAFPLLVVWAELARNPKNRNENIALCNPRAKREHKAGILYLPTLYSTENHPRFSPELMTIKDLELLEELNLLPTEEKLISLFAFYCNPFISNGKPVLSWLSLFWLRRYCVKNNRTSEFSECLYASEASNLPLATTLSREFIENIPTYYRDRESEQDLEKILREEQNHYTNPPLNKIVPLQDFLSKIGSPSFSRGLKHIIQQKPLYYAEPNLEGFETSTKWKCIVFLSLTAVCSQLDMQPIRNVLQELWTFDHKTYIYLLKWINNREETARIYNAYYEYWMTRFWEEENV
jgi:hypothetical protein